MINSGVWGIMLPSFSRQNSRLERVSYDVRNAVGSKRHRRIHFLPPSRTEMENQSYLQF